MYGILCCCRSRFLAWLKERWKKQRKKQRGEQREGKGEEQREEQRSSRNQSDPEEVHRLVKIAKRLEELGPEPGEHPQSCSDEKLEEVEFERKERLALLEEEKLLKVCVCQTQPYTVCGLHEFPNCVVFVIFAMSKIVFF